MTSRRVHRSFPLTLSFVAAALAGGCSSSYVTPGAPADFRALGITPEAATAMTDASIEEKLSRRPAAAFPATVATVRVQGKEYRSHTQRGYGDGPYTVVTARDVETDLDMQKIAALPMVRAIAPANRLILRSTIQTEYDLRQVAAYVQADILLLYTFDTQFETDTSIPVVGVITLGLFPNEIARCRSTASAAFIDTRTGFIYGLAEGSAERSRLANAWTTDDALDNARRDAERDAFEKLVGELTTTWTGIVHAYGPSAGQVEAAMTPTPADPAPPSAGVMRSEEK